MCLVAKCWNKACSVVYYYTVWKKNPFVGIVCSTASAPALAMHWQSDKTPIAPTLSPAQPVIGRIIVLQVRHNAFSSNYEDL